MGVSPIAILCNGPTLEDHFKDGNLKRIPCETLGVNHAWEVANCSYNLMIDPAQWADYRRVTGKDISTLSNLWSSTTGPESATKIRILDTMEPRFSFHPLEFGAWLCHTVTWVALQLAVSWGKNPIFFLGLDLKPRGSKGKFYGGTWDPHMEARQRELFGYARGFLGMSGIEMVNVFHKKPEDSKLWALRKQSFDEAFSRWL